MNRKITRHGIEATVPESPRFKVLLDANQEETWAYLQRDPDAFPGPIGIDESLSIFAATAAAEWRQGITPDMAACEIAEFEDEGAHWDAIYRKSEKETS